MTDAQRQLLTAAVQAMRRKIKPGDSMHPLWDMVFTADRALAGDAFYWPFDSLESLIEAAYDEARK